MLRLYYGRENLDKSRFTFEEIARSLQRCRSGSSKAAGVILLVPDQFTLQAEREAFAYMDVEGLMDLDILSQSRLGYRVLNETGGSRRLHIDRYGRHMLLTKIITGMEEELQAFLSMKKSHAFIELANDLITEMKQYNVTPETLPEKIAALPEDGLLRKKLADVEKIYDKYEKAICGKYMDNEDYTNLVAARISQSARIAAAEIWVTGFDSFTPNALRLLEQLVCHSAGVNVVMTAEESGKADSDLFALSRRMMDRLEYAAQRNSVSCERYPIPASFAYGGKESALVHLEQQLYAYPHKEWHFQAAKAGDGAAAPSGRDDAVHFCRAANFYTEAETAAAEITELVRDRGLRYSDITVICNDMEGRGSVIKRVFAEYDIPVFLDRKRNILHNPAVELILALMDIAENNWSFDDVFRFVKTGLVGHADTRQWEALENYALQYKIRGSAWKRPFKYGKTQIPEERLQELDQLRGFLAGLCAAFEDGWKRSGTVREQTAALYSFLQEKLQLPQKLTALQEELVVSGALENAEEIGQTWNIILALLDQLVELLGDEQLGAREYGKLLRSGFESVELGLLPPSEDQVLVGTMQRTRTGRQKALLVVGANDGILPASSSDKALLNDDEKAYLLARKIELCRDETQREQEERLAIYKTLSIPAEFFWISYAVTDLDGKECKPSMVYDKLRQIFPDAEEKKDIENRGELLSMAQTKRSAMNHMAKVLEKLLKGDSADTGWKSVYNWCLHAADELSLKKDMETLRYGLLYDNKIGRMDRALADSLYKAGSDWELVLSPSRLEKFGRCPFAHFVQYGLKPEERRIFEIAGREVGDAYHECLMRLSAELSLEGMPITAPDSPWMKLTESQCGEKIRSLMEEISREYREGIMDKGEEERYRAERMVQVAQKAAWALVSHVQAGTIEKIYFEAEFGQGEEKPFQPVTVEVDGQRIRIEGKIDRVDMLSPDGDASSYVKIIDYKSGKEKFDMEEARSGWRIQLMLYLEAVMGSLEKEKKNAKPAGVFYFEIAEPMLEERFSTEEGFEEKLREKLMRSFKMDGVLLDDPLVIESMDHDFTGHSAVIPVQKKKDGSFSGSSENKLLDEEAFEAFRTQVTRKIEELCGELLSGSAAIEPRKSKDSTACKYCNFRGICQFDTMFSGCRYRTRL